MKLDIAGEILMLTVPYSQQEEKRQSEAEINMLYETWRRRFPEKDDRELLAMIAFRYAERYAALTREREQAVDLADEINARLDALIESAG